jgi:hypothetical protein
VHEITCQGGGEVGALSTQVQYSCKGRPLGISTLQVRPPVPGPCLGFNFYSIAYLNEPGAVRRWVHQEDDPRAVEFVPKDIGTDPTLDHTTRYLSWLSLLPLRLNKVFVGRLSRAD